MRNIAVFLLAPLLIFAGPRYIVEPFAGSTWIGDGGPAREALLFQAEGIATDRDGNIYVSDAQTHRVRRIRPSGVIDTIAGTGIPGLAGDGGPATNAQLYAPYGIAVDSSGNLYIADLGNRRIRLVTRDGLITTVASNFQSPRNVAVDLAGNIYVSDFAASRVVRISTSGQATTLADANIVDHPAGLAVDRGGTVYIGDTGNHAIWKWQNGFVTKHAVAQTPTGLALDGAGKLWIADPGEAAGTLLARDVAVASNGSLYTTDGRLIRRIFAGTTSVIAGLGDRARGDGGPALEARLNNPSGLALDAQGNLFIADRDNHRVRKVDGRGILTTIAGSGLPGSDGDNGPAASASLNAPTALQFDADGNLYVLDSGNKRVRRIGTDGRITAARSLPDAASSYVIDAAQRLAYVDPTGAVELLELSQPITLPTAIVAANDGTLYVADADQDRVWKLTPEALPPDPVSLLRMPDRIVPGMIAIFSGYTFTQPEIVFGDTIGTVLSGTSDSIAVLAPATLQPGSLDVEIRDQGKTVARTSATVSAAAPQLFAAMNEDGSANAFDTPAARGSILVLYGTGQGVTPQATSVQIYGYEAEILYNGAVAGYPGLWQLNMRVPGGFLPPGTYPLTVNVGGAISASLYVSII
jgi:uncharacterized protein (TIGR03437 family)